ncbi:hypothetical protein AMATHDRAFT_151540 [Amanita thiersii Skay4041]|uniref:Uncharacterized protein n=1 Tax=Amanita thiersii Skay4041 TaxID=703135 RepID=A0A2A9NIZ0_9AGAR|nr:hypothetical protein AMATHDRAFT_151540 [Amanita thiersii Skay4041]
MAKEARYPIMPESDIMASLADWGIAVSEQQLSRPTQDFVEGIFCACLRQVSELDHEALREPLQEVLDMSQVDDKELYATAFATNIVHHHLARFARAARIKRFSSKDAFNPERERTLYLLSGFINFVQFTEQYCNPFVNELREQSDGILVEREQVLAQLAEAQQRLDAMKAKIAEDEPVCEQLRNENNTLRAKMFATKEFQTAAVQEVEKLKTQKNALIKHREALKMELSNISDAISSKRPRLVQSPDRIKGIISTMKANVVEEKRTVAIHEAKARDLQVKLNALSSIEKNILGSIEQLQSIEKEAHQLDMLQKALAEMRDQLDNKKIEKSELGIKQERAKTQLENASEKLKRAQTHAERKKQDNQRTLDRLQRQYDKMDIERKDNDKHLDELRREAENIESQMKEHLRSNETELNELLAEYGKLRHETGQDIIQFY